MRSKLLGLDTDIRTAAVIDQVAHSNGQDEGAQDAGADATSLRSFLETKCGARTVVVDGMSGNLPSPKTWPERPTIIEVDFEAPAAAGRADQLYLNDAIIASLIDLVPSTDYTLLYTTTPVDSSIAFPLDSEAHGSKLGQLGSDLLHEAERLLHLQTKRDIGGKETGEETDGDESAEFIPGGVFERYQFLSPGIFMGLFAGFFFITIIYVAISAITSLEISYGSFARDTSSQAAKKAQ
ncbi:hypothetical protein KEM52_002313 [Ascosphaera acerosa]|nr:hypothetical protein KEM52_002313 [Ascosphaera acerosa]